MQNFCNLKVELHYISGMSISINILIILRLFFFYFANSAFMPFIVHGKKNLTH